MFGSDFISRVINFLVITKVDFSLHHFPLTLYIYFGGLSDQIDLYLC